MISSYLHPPSLNYAGIFSTLFDHGLDNMTEKKIVEIQVTYHLPFVVCFIFILNDFSEMALAKN